MKISLFLPLLCMGIWMACTSSQTSRMRDEQYRPQIHFSPEANWMNDPNGMVYYEGEYHLFYQYYPDSTVWGPMHWGHAVSTDMVHWEELPIAIYPDSLGWIFSGSAVIDWNNTTGLGTKENPPMVAIYTFHNHEKELAGDNDFQYQGISYSLDKGRTWSTYEHNPVLPNPGIRDFRDPKVRWSPEFNKWFMILAVVDHVNIYSSDNLLSWELESEFGKTNGAHGGVWECPDFFPMEVAGEDSVKWVMLVSMNPGAPNGGSGTQYFVGDFDGHQFSPAVTETHWLDYGKDNYAGVTWSDIPDSDGRRLFIGWMNNWQYATVIPTSTWRSAMTIPRELILTQSGCVISKPVKELLNLRSVEEKLTQKNIDEKIELCKLDDEATEILLDFSKGADQNWHLLLENKGGDQVLLGFDKSQNQLYIDNTFNGWDNEKGEFAIKSAAPLKATGELNLRIFIDRSSIEVFVNDGEVVMTNQFFPKNPFETLSIIPEAQGLTLDSGSIFKLSSVWNANH